MINFKRLTFLLLFNIFFLADFAQSDDIITVKGRVTDSEGLGLPGVTISSNNDNSIKSTITNLEGYYSIVVRKNDYLFFSYIGFKQYNTKVLTQDQINVVLEEADNQLGEVVITVPYGVVKKSTFTGSAGVISDKAISSSLGSSLSSALQGNVAGLQSFSFDGSPGSDLDIFIRGLGSVNASSAPLYVLDGVPYSGSLSSISSQDIISVTVLKDAAAATLYGSRAANGVIMITTKQGSHNSPPNIELTTKYGFSSRAVKDYERLGTNDYFMLQWEAIRNAYTDRKYSSTDAAQKASSELLSYIGINPYGRKYAEPVGVDGKLISGIRPLWDDSWEDALTQNAHYTDINARISGGGENSKYYFSLGYLDNQGAYINSGFKRYSLRSNITANLRRWLEVGLNVSGTYSLQDTPKQYYADIGNVVVAAQLTPSFYPIYERNLDTGEYLLENGNKIYDYGLYRKSTYNGYNFAQSLDYDKSQIKRDVVSARGYMLISPIKGLSYKMSLNLDYQNRVLHEYENPSYGKKPLLGSAFKSNERSTSVTFNNVVNWEYTFNSMHNLRLLGGQEYFEYNASNFYGSRAGVISDGYYEPDAASSLTSFGGNSDQYKLLSYFGSVEYSLNQKYFLSASARTDGSSRFHPDNRWGTFWSFGGSWRANQELFLEDAQDWLSNLTLRGSYGAQGNDNVGYYAYKALYDIGSFLGQHTLYPSRLETADLSWETNLNLNLGLEFGLFNNRLSGIVEYFVRTSKDLLFAREVVPSSGFSTIDTNDGKLKNYGWELTLNGTPIHTKDWSWHLSVNATSYKNKIISLPSGERWYGSYKKWVEGGSLQDYWLYDWAGVNVTNGNPQWYYYDEQGKKQITDNYYKLQPKDKVKAGSSLPVLSGGFQSNLTWKGISLSTLFSYGIGGKVYNTEMVRLMSVSGMNGVSISKNILSRWTPEHPNTNVPRLVQGGTDTFTLPSNYWLVDRSYLRLKTITLNYNLPKSWLRSVSLKDVDVFIQGDNLLTFNKQQGLDPEQSVYGVASFVYPAMKTISFGVNVKL